MSKIAKPLQDDEVEEVDEDDSSVDETKKAASGFTPTQRVSWPWGSAEPPNEPETALDAAKGTRGESGRTNRTLGGREEAEKASQDDHRPDSVVGDSHSGSFEAKLASGFARQAGRHTAYTGPLTRGGRVKIFAETVGAEQLDEWTERVPELAKLAKELFRGRNATILEGRILNPLLGKPQRSAEDLAAQFNVKPARIYKIAEKRLRHLLKEFNRRNKPEAGNGERCPTCGRVYAEWNFSQCARNYGGPLEKPALNEGFLGVTWDINWNRARFGRRPGIHPECLPEKYWPDVRAMERKYLLRGAAGGK
jgi:hypothetical protein